MSFLPTFSRLELARNCVYPWTGGLKWPKRPRSEYASFGAAISVVAQVATVWGAFPDELLGELGDRENLSDEDSRKLKLCTSYLVELLAEEAATDQWRKAETALVYDFRRRTARELVQRAKVVEGSLQVDERDYADVRDGETWGKPDLVRLRGDGVLVVRDYKSGRSAKGESPKSLFQLRALGLAAARAYGVDEVTIEIAHIDEFGIHILDATLGLFALDSAAAELEQIVDRIESSPAEPLRPGRWCKQNYCPVLATCPATQVAMATVTAAIHPRFPLSLELLSAEHAGYQRHVLKVLRDALDVYDQAVKDFAAREPIPAGDGRVYGKVETTRNAIDCTAAAEKVLREHGIEAAIEKSTSKAAIERAVKAKAPKGKAAAQTREVLGQLQAAGAIRSSTFSKFDEYEASKGA